MNNRRVWYFAYGANMQSATLRGRRRIQFSRALPARVPGWRLVFDKPPLIPIGESFANILPDTAAQVLGVAFEVTADDLEHIELTEGVRIGNYDRAAVSVEPLPAPVSPVPAFTLTSDRRDPSLRPSTRYMELLISGATEHGLPADYIAWLRAVPAQEPTAAALRFRELMDEVLRSRR